MHISKYIRRAKKIFFNPRIIVNILNRRIFKIGLKNKDRDIAYLNTWIYGDIIRKDLKELFKGIEAESFLLVSAFNRTHNMSMTLNELCSILAIIKIIHAKHVLEIGTYDGGTTINIAANLPQNGKITTVDLPKGFKKFSLDASKYNITTLYENVGKQIKNFKEKKKIIQLFRDSAELDISDFNTKFDLAIIDGCHEYSYVKNDTELAFKVVRKGGIILWHDYGMIEDVTRYVDEIYNQKEVYAIMGTRIAYIFN